MAQIVAAYELLRDPDRRAAYDRSLRIRQGRRPARAHNESGAEEGVSLSLLGGLIGLDVKRRRRSS